MKKHSKFLIGIIAAIVAMAVVIMLIALAPLAQNEGTYSSHIELAQRYLDELQYEQAIAEYKTAISIEPNNVEAYLALAEIYVVIEDYKAAINVLYQGIEQTNSDELAEYLEEVQEAYRSVIEAAESSVVEATGAPMKEIVEESWEDSNFEIEIDDNPRLSLGARHSAYITDDGCLYMWGGNGNGQLGNNPAWNEIYDSAVPIKIMENVKSVSLGGDHSAAITTDGSLYMWGYNGLGQLGDGTTEDKYAPVKIMDNVKLVSLGGYHSAAITTEGSLYMWGWNSYGELGDGTTEDRYVPVKIMDNVKSVSLGDSFSAAITKDGSLYMWGKNWYGNLGYVTYEGNVPVKIMNNVKSVSLGHNFSAAITEDGSLYMWGGNEYGQLGIDRTLNEIYSSETPIKIMENVKSVSLGWYHSAAITTDGSLYLWGWNEYGQLGDGTSGWDNSRSTPVIIMDNVKSVCLGVSNSAAITTDGKVYAWGWNGSGGLGDGTAEDKLIPTPITIVSTISTLSLATVPVDLSTRTIQKI